MATTIVTGMRTTDYVSSSLIKRDVYEAIYMFKPYQTPVTQFFLANKKAKLPTGNPKFETQEDILVPYSTTLTGNVAASGTSQAVACTTSEGYYFKAGDILRNCTTNENYRVISTAASAITFCALDNSTALTATTAASVVLRVGYAAAEGTASATALSTQSTFPLNYTQIFKQAVEMSGTQLATENYGGDDWTNQRVKATEEFKLDLERAFIYGIQCQRTTAGGYIRTTGGLTDSTAAGMGITNTYQYVGSDFASEDYFFNTFLKGVFAKGTNVKTLYCGSDSVLGINNFSKVKQQTRVSESEYGVDIDMVKTPFGMAKVVWHPILSNGYSNWVIAVDKEDYMKYRFLSANGKNRDMQYQQNIQTPDVDERKDQYLAEIGFQLAGGSKGVHGILYPGASA